MWIRGVVCFVVVLFSSLTFAEETTPVINDENDLSLVVHQLSDKNDEDARPIDTTDSAVVMPADGLISQFGTILDTQLLQAKGHFYSLESLLRVK
ncbi:Phosphatidylserine decarboxylase [Gilliamella apis SCGC AB-598-P17]|nr:Phosphatidylserine decarboxylase [Gilliamella apis SCGC AB-598-P17]